LLLTVELLSVKPPWLKIPPPPLAFPKPLVMVKPEMVTFDAKLSNTREVALPSNARLAAPGPLVVTFLVIGNSPLVSTIVPDTLVASIVSAAELVKQSRRLPAPTSFVFDTVQVAP
jgi:hypothetical protein